MNRKYITILLALILVVGIGYSREVQKVGTTSMQSLKISGSVRAIGMGDAYVAVADDIQSIFWNPAGLIHLKGTATLFSQINMPADVQFNNIAVAKNLGRRGVVGLHLLAMNTGDMEVRTWQHPEGTGEKFIAYDIVGGVSYAQRLTDRFIFGFNVRILQTGLENATFTSVLADIGTLYETALRSLKLGFSVQNFGPDIDYDGSYYDYLDQGRRGREEAQENDYHGAPPPTIYRIGLSANLFEMTGLKRPPMMDGIMSIEMSHPNDNRERINFGLELCYMNMFFLRGGHKLRYKNQFGYDEERWTGGFGLNIPLPGEKSIQIDYAYTGFGRIAEAADDFMASPHRFSLSYKFGGKVERAKKPSPTPVVEEIKEPEKIGNEKIDNFVVSASSLNDRLKALRDKLVKVSDRLEKTNNVLVDIDEHPDGPIGWGKDQGILAFSRIVRPPKVGTDVEEVFVELSEAEEGFIDKLAAAINAKADWEFIDKLAVEINKPTEDDQEKILIDMLLSLKVDYDFIKIVHEKLVIIKDSIHDGKSSLDTVPDDLKAIGLEAQQLLNLAAELSVEAKSLGSRKAPAALKAIETTSSLLRNIQEEVKQIDDELQKVLQEIEKVFPKIDGVLK